MIADDVGSSPAQSIYFHVIPINRIVRRGKMFQGSRECDLEKKVGDENEDD